MTTDEKLSKFIPLDKSWTIRMGFKDAIVQNKSYTIQKLEAHNQNQTISDDLLALVRVLYSLKSAFLEDPVSVGESATLYRFLKYFLATSGLKKEIIKEGTLLDRKITDPTQNLSKMTYSQLLKLDNGTSQYASIKGLFDNLQKKSKLYPYHLNMTVEANKHWEKTSGHWRLRLDDTIYKQVKHFKEGRDFALDRAEHFCYAYMFGLVTLEEAEKAWPQLINHETNRLKEIVEQKQLLLDGSVLDSLDHRVIQAVVLYAIKNGIGFTVSEPAKKSVNKTWPAFWTFAEQL